MASKAELALILSLVDDVTDTAKRVKGDLGDVGKEAQGAQGFVEGLGKVGFAVLKAGAIVAAAAITTAVAGLTALAKAAWDAATQVDEAMDTIIVKTGATGPALDALEGSFKTVFGNFPADAQSVAEVIAGLNQRLGMSGPELERLSTGILSLSKLTGTDASQNITDFTRVMGDWGISNDKAQVTLDQLFATTQMTGVGINDLMTNVVQFGAPLRLMGFTLEESMLLFGKWAKEGVNAETVMSSLRIAAGKFAKEQEKGNKVVVGGVDDMAAATTQLDELRKSLSLATIQQSEFTDKTKESSRVAKQMQIDKLTKQITELEAAMALGVKRTITTVDTNKSLGTSLRETFEAIKNNTDASAALALGMEIFGAKAGPDMVAAIREGRFALGDLETALNNSTDALEFTMAATADWPEVMQLVKNQVTLALEPIGTQFLDLAKIVLEKFLPVFTDKIVPFFNDNVMPVFATLADAIALLLDGDLGGAIDKLLPDSVIKRWGDFAPILGSLGGMIKTALKGITGENIWEDTTIIDLEGTRVIPGLKSQLLALGRNIPIWIGAGLTELSDWVIDKITSIFTDTAQQEKVGAGINTLITEGLKLVGSIAKGLLDFGNQVVTDMLESLDTAAISSTANTTGQAIGEKLGEFIKAGINSLLGLNATGTSILDSISSGVTNAAASYDFAQRTGRTVAVGILTGIVNSIAGTKLTGAPISDWINSYFSLVPDFTAFGAVGTWGTKVGNLIGDLIKKGIVGKVTPSEQEIIDAWEGEPLGVKIWRAIVAIEEGTDPISIGIMSWFYFAWVDVKAWFAQAVIDVGLWGASMGVAISNISSTIIAAIKWPFEQAWTELTRIFPTQTTDVSNWITGLGDTITTAASAVYNAIVAPFVNAWNWIKANIPGMGGVAVQMPQIPTIPQVPTIPVIPPVANNPAPVYGPQPAPGYTPPVTIGPGGQLQVPGNSYTMNIYTSAPTEDIIADFSLLNAMAGA
jgi:hypothetical protein